MDASKRKSDDVIATQVADLDRTPDINPADQQAIMSKLKVQGLYFTHEVVYEGGDGVRSDQFTGIGDVQE